VSNPRLAPGPAAPAPDGASGRRLPSSGSSAIFPPGAAEHDLALQQDLVLLLSKLEQHRARLANPGPEQKHVTVLQVAVAMVKDLVQAGEGGQGAGTGPEALAAAQAKAAAFLGPTEALLAQLDDPSLVRALVRMFRKPQDAGEQLRQVRQAAQGLVEVLQTFFTLHEASFQVPAAAESWSQAQALFVTDLLHDFYRLHG
jgi:hypothetical protein